MDIFEVHYFFSTLVERGGIVMWPILFVSVVIWFISFGRLMTIIKTRKKRNRFLEIIGKFSVNGKIQANTGEESFDNFLFALTDMKTGKKSFFNYYRELLMVTVSDLERGFLTISVWIGVAPLLGLLGTVVGMVETFEVINIYGIGNPHLMANGISKALLTTQAGLTIAFPALLFQLYLKNKKKKLVFLLKSDREIIAKMLNLTSF